MKNAILATTVVLACAVGGAFPAASANFITNGDFSTPAVSPGWGGFTPAQTGWTDSAEVGGDVEIGNSGIYGLPCENSACQNLEVNFNNFGDVYQTVSLTAGDTYDLSFLYGGRTSGGPQEIRVFADGILLATLTATPGSWTSENFDFKAPATSDKIEFQTVPNVPGGDLQSYGNEITNVSLGAVPEPANWVLLLGGFGMLGFALRRRSKSISIAT
jgi:hypothetical protein